MRNGSDNPIEYRERSPLVIPPSRDLPPPQQAGAGQTPAWPSDPDVKRKKAAAEKRKQAIYDPDAEVRNLSPSELNRGSTGSTRASAGTRTDGSDVGKNESPSGLGYLGGLWSSFGGGQKEERERAEIARTMLAKQLTSAQIWAAKVEAADWLTDKAIQC